MTTRTLVLSNVVVAVVCLGIGFGVGQMTGPAPIAGSEKEAGPSAGVSQTGLAVKEALDQPSSRSDELEKAVAQIAALQAELEDGADDPGVQEAAVLDAATEDTASTAQTPKQKLAAYRKLMEDPEVRKAMMEESLKVVANPEMQKRQRDRETVTAKFLFAELLDDLNLDDEQRDAFFSHYVDGQMAEMQVRMDLQMRLSAGEIGEDEQAAVAERIEASKQESLQRMAEFLGTDFDAYEAYAATMNERGNLKKMYSGGQPLDDYTEEAILAIMGEEKAAAGIVEPYFGMDLERALVIQRQSLVMQQARDARVIERAASYLTEDQHEILVDSLNGTRSQFETNIKYMEAALAEREKSKEADEDE